MGVNNSEALSKASCSTKAISQPIILFMDGYVVVNFFNQLHILGENLVYFGLKTIARMGGLTQLTVAPVIDHSRTCDVSPFFIYRQHFSVVLRVELTNYDNNYRFCI